MDRSKKEFDKIKRIFDLAWNNPYSSFYKEKYKKAGIKSIKNIKTWQDFNNLPFLTREEIVEAGPEKFLFFPKDKIASTGLSSGTTGGKYPLVIYCPRFSKTYKKMHKKYIDIGIKSLLMLYNPFTAHHRYRYDIDFLGERTRIFVGDLNNLESTAKVASRTQIDSIKTTSTALYRFIPHLEKEYDLNNIKLVCLGGEYTSEQKADYFKSVFKNAFFEYTFGSVETKGKGYRCDVLSKLAPRFFHGDSEAFYYEALDSNGQEELVLTSAYQDGNILIRYKTGDAARLFEKDCPCGEKIQMEVFGRLGHDAIKVQGASIYSALIDKTLVPFEKYLASSEWKLHVFEEKINGKLMPKLKLQLIPHKKHNNSKIKELIIKGVSKNLFITTRFTLFDLVEKGEFQPLEVEFLEEFPAELKPKHIISHLK